MYCLYFFRKELRMAEHFHKGHRERLRKRFLASGLDDFQDHEILELLLFYAIPQRDTNNIAHELIQKCGGFINVFDADINLLKEVKFISENTAVLLKIIPQILKKYAVAKNPNVSNNDFENILAFFKNLFIGETIEKLIVACLSERLNIISTKVVASGITNNLSVNIKKIIEFTYHSNCSLIVLAHNHPNGLAIPSPEDIKTTRHLYNIFKPVGINLLDHIIVADNKAVSMKECGALSLID